MLQTLSLIFIRNLKSSKTFTIINIFGLSLGICFSGLIYIFIKSESNFDQLHEYKDRIFRIESNLYNQNATGTDKFRGFSELSAPLIGAIRTQVPEIQSSSRIINSYSDAVVKYDTKAFAEKITYVDSGFFKMFSFIIVKGNSNNPFENNLSAVLTRSTADKYFKNEDPIGKLILIDSNGEELYKISAVIDDPPINSSINFRILVPIESSSYYKDYSDLWNEYTYSFFVLLRNGSPEDIFVNKLNRLVQMVMKEHIADLRDILAIPGTIDVVYHLTMTKLPFIHSNTRIPWEGTSSVKNIYILSGIVAIIILISCINFVSVALTRATSRGKEVGVRKINGASRQHLVFQFILESFGHTVIASLLGLILLAVLSMKFNDIIGKKIAFDFSYFDVLAFFSIGLTITALSSFYPALLLSSLNPATILKSQFSYRIKTGLISSLVVLQFSLSMFLAVCAMVMLQQMKFINSKDLGFDRKQVICIPTYAARPEATATVEKIKHRVLQMPGVISVAGVSRSFFKGISSMGYVNSRDEKNSAKVYSVDTDYIKTLGLTVVAGRNFDETRKTDESSIIINETFAMGMPANPLDHKLIWGARSDSSEIIGIVKDFHFRSLERPVEPLFLTMNHKTAGPLQTVLVRFSGDIANIITGLRRIWDDVNPGKPFEVSFLENDVAKQYESHQRWNRIISISTAFAWVIACVGLFGLAGINTVRRYHEVGIRKTLGSTTFDLILLLNTRYLAMLCISFFIAVPSSYYVMNDWLRNFAFQITLDWVIYAEIFLIFTIVAMVTISYHTVKGALINPSQTLRYE